MQASSESETSEAKVSASSGIRGVITLFGESSLGAGVGSDVASWSWKLGWWAFKGSIRDGLVSPILDPSQPDPMLPYAVALNEARQWVNHIRAVPPWFLPDGPREQTRQGLHGAYRGFIGADSWDLQGGPNIKSMSTTQGGGGGGDAAGDGGGG